ncbi:MAG: N-acetylmuramoyl-L-alanine amidase [Hyphomicrobiaceae bacterium]
MDRAPRTGAAVQALTIALALLIPCLAPAANAQIVPVKAEPNAWQTQIRPDALNGDTKRTRFVVRLDREARYQFLNLSNRLVIELPDVKLLLPPPNDTPVGLVQGFTGGLAGPGRSRVIIDVTQPVAIENDRIEKAPDGKGYLLAFEMIPVEAATKPEPKMRSLAKPSGLGAAGVEPPQPRPAVTRDTARSNTYKPTIVIDPGHGGHDSGAMKHETVEKDVVLAFSLALRDKLKATGRYNVLMTRDTDVFVPLDERRDFGEKNKAQLFIAVHADYASTQARGATIYSLREGMFNSLKKSAKTNETVSEKHRATLQQIGSDTKALENILSDLTQREFATNDNSTSQFRTKAIEFMDAATTLRDNPEQSANFRVLLTAKVPSVLIELAYVSNQQDAKLLKSDEWRDKVSESIATAVENYFEDRKSRLPM